MHKLAKVEGALLSFGLTGDAFERTPSSAMNPACSRVAEAGIPQKDNGAIQFIACAEKLGVHR